MNNISADIILICKKQIGQFIDHFNCEYSIDKSLLINIFIDNNKKFPVTDTKKHLSLILPKKDRQLFELAEQEFKKPSDSRIFDKSNYTSDKKIAIDETKQRTAVLSVDAKRASYSKMTNQQLKNLCEAKFLKVSGKKDELINRLLFPFNPEHRAKLTNKLKNFSNSEKAQQIVDKLTSSVAKLIIRKNDHGYYCHVNSNLVFDPNTLKVIGKWNDRTNLVDWLSSDDIYLCHQLKVLYDLPENLDFGKVVIRDKVVDEFLTDEDFKDEALEESEDENNEEDENDGYIKTD